ncbi:MAG: alginate export family protein [Candidatus Omnitrophota bacterium]
MSKRLIVVIALAFVVGMAFTAFAEVQNVKVSGDITVMGVARNNLSLKTADITATTQGFSRKITALISNVRVKVEADLTDNVSTVVRLLNERVWGAGNQLNAAGTTTVANTTEIDLDLAYVTLKEFLNPHLTLSIGRQEMKFGNGLVIGAASTNGIGTGHGTTDKRGLPGSLDDLSSSKAFDAMRATLNFDPLVLDVVYSKINENSVAIEDDINLYGVNAGFKIDDNLNAEVYLFSRNRDTGSIGAITSSETLNTTGARLAFTGIENMILGIEGAFQFGEHQANTTLYPNDVASAPDANKNRQVRAFALQAIANMAMPSKKYTPSVGGSYTFLSGDKARSTSDSYTGWDPMFEDQAGGTLFNKILGYSNAQLLNLNGSVKPMEDLKVALNYYYIRLNNSFTGNNLINFSGVAGDPTYAVKAGKKYLGSEIDLGVTYDYTEDVQFGLNTGIFMPGNVFVAGNNKKASQVVGSMKVTF